ncbi:uncharacterized protein B0H18DRAFT_1118616 [Fomitopsis serialis]|uniref:uncharacterized protein n=1 Tax=Fomitopsis serialis TaxID=139415 RepID=UPI0020085AA7|nr:uncharacterized protein B0H18DRAFT_1118616 [Neoantrodia serialis]KAH9927360.1 hypothetical protein B0H18DRAFT_1118616 [Neoantrodia serialis]
MSSDAQASQRHTRAANAFAHPGLPDVKEPVKRRSKKEIEAARKAQEAANDAAERGRTTAVKSVASVQHDMKQRDAQEQAQRVLPPKFAVKAYKSSTNVGPESQAVDHDISDTESLDSPLAVAPVPPKKTKLKKVTRKEIDAFPVTTTAAAEQAVPKTLTEKHEVASGKRKSTAGSGEGVPAPKKPKPTHPSGLLVSWRGTKSSTAPSSAKSHSKPEGTPTVPAATLASTMPEDTTGEVDGYESGDSSSSLFNNDIIIFQGIVSVDSEGEELVPKSKGKKSSGVGFIDLGSDFAQAVQTKVSAQNVTSQAITQPADERQGSRRRTVTNHDLPRGTLQRYNKVFMPKLIHVIACLANPWELQVIDFAAELRRLWDEVFPDVVLGYEVEAGSLLYTLSMQRIYNWRSSFGANAINAVEKFWVNVGIEDPRDRAECARVALGQGKPYLFGHVEFMPDGQTIVVIHSVRLLRVRTSAKGFSLL